MNGITGVIVGALIVAIAIFAVIKYQDDKQVDQPAGLNIELNTGSNN